MGITPILSGIARAVDSSFHLQVFRALRTTGQSGFELSGTMAAGTATAKIISLYETPDNELGTYAIMEVLINEHLLKDNAGI